MANVSNTIGLCMIVKDEAELIRRCLASALPLIDYILVVDTGSTDETQQIVSDFLAEHGVRGQVIDEPWRDFAYNRSFALEHLREVADIDYALILDADDVLVIEPDFDLNAFKAQMCHDHYDLLVDEGAVTHYRGHICSNRLPYAYKGVLHEYLAAPPGERGHAKARGLSIRASRGGARSRNPHKYHDDAAVLERALASETDPGLVSRYTFYLAQSYRDAGRLDESAEAYGKRAEMGGWVEEAWHARLAQARCLKDLQDEGGFLRQALAAFNQRPHRAEPLYDLARYHRDRGLHETAALFAERGLAIERPNGDTLFVEDFVYQWGLQEEYSIAANYAHDPARKDRGFAACNWLALNRDVPSGTRDLARYNLRFYVEPAAKLLPSFAAQPVGFTPPEGWHPMNPSVARRGDKIVMVQRTVNFVLEGGDYRTPGDGPVVTRNFLLRLDAALAVKSSVEILPPADLPPPAFGLVLGFEDMRLFAWQGALWCIAVLCELTPEGWRQQVLARIDESGEGPYRLVDWRVLEPPGPPRHEKNWMPLVSGDELCFVYLCDPTRLVDEMARTVAGTIPTIAAEEFRGGTQAIAFAGGWLALVHEVGFSGVDNKQRLYHHRFVWFDAAQKLRGVSRPFIFERPGIEFAAGLAWHPDGQRLIISYGVGDGTAWLATVDADDVRAALLDAARLPSGVPAADPGRLSLDAVKTDDAGPHAESECVETVEPETPAAYRTTAPVGAAAEQEAPQTDQPPTPELGSFGAEDFETQHALRPARDLHALVAPYPRVLIAILAKQKERSLPLFLSCIEGLDYPKSAIFLYARTNNNTDRTEQILREWIERVGPSYAGVEFDAEPVDEQVEEFPPHEWNSTRFHVLGDIRNVSLQKTLEHACDFYFVCDSDNFIRSCTLRELVALNLPIVAPFLRVTNPNHSYSNFFAEIDAAGFYAGCEEYQWITHRWVRGVFEVPVVHCTYLVRNDVIPELHYLDGSDDWEFAVFCKSAREAGIPQYLDNRQVYGYLTFDPESNATQVNVAGGPSDQIGFARAELEKVDELKFSDPGEPIEVDDSAEELERRFVGIHERQSFGPGGGGPAAAMHSAPQVDRHNAALVFIHAAPRTSSTWFWSRFREYSSTLCFSEPFNPQLGWITRESAVTWVHSSSQLRHPLTEPYYQEYVPLIRGSGAVELFDPAMSSQWFIPLGGLRGDLRQTEKDYLSLLLRHAHAAGKVPVLKFTRSLGRLWAIRNAFGGFHVFLHRNLWQQWSSYLYYARRANQHFYETTARILGVSDDPFLAGIAEFYLKRAFDFRQRRDDQEDQSLSDDQRLRLLISLPESHAFAMFMALHIYLYLHALSAADLAVDVTRLTKDSEYRSQIESELSRQTGLEISLSDVAGEQRESGVAIGAAAIDWDEIREHARAAVRALSAFADPLKLMENASAFINSAIEEMRKSQAALAMRSDAAEEIWYARLQEARSHWALGDDDGFVRQALDLCNERPNRAEPLFDLARFHRERGLHEAAMHFAEAGLALARPDNDAKFLENPVYQWGLEEEISIAGFFCRDSARKERGAAACDWLALNRNVPDYVRDHALGNLHYYVKRAEVLLPSLRFHPLIVDAPDGFHPANSGVCRDGNRLSVMVRTVNWVLRDGAYPLLPGYSNWQSRLILVILSDDLQIISSREVFPPDDLPTPRSTADVGFRDPRPFVWRGELWCICSFREQNEKALQEMILARVDRSNPDRYVLADWRLIPSGMPEKVEGNWMPQVVADDLRLIYSVDPTRILTDTGTVLYDQPASVAAQGFRGGSQAVAFDGGWLMIVHETEYIERGRRYFHRFIWLDPENALRRLSPRFYLHEIGYEFVAGMTWHPDGESLVISFSVNDADQFLAVVRADDVPAILRPVEKHERFGRRATYSPAVQASEQPFAIGGDNAPATGVDVTDVRWQAAEEYHLRRFFAHFKIDCVFDVGANRGQYRSILRDQVGFKGPIISFEPIPWLSESLISIKIQQNDTNWFIENTALDYQAGKADFNVMISDEFSSLKEPDHSEIGLFANMNCVSNTILVRKQTLQYYFDKYKELLRFNRPFLKMDTQGNDVAVFDSAGSCAQKFVGLQSELSFKRIYQDTIFSHEAISHYAEKGFILSALVPNNAGHFPDLVEMDCIMYNGVEFDEGLAVHPEGKPVIASYGVGGGPGQLPALATAAAVSSSGSSTLPIHVINLDRTPDRLAAFYRRNAHLRDVERFRAIDGRSLDRKELISEGVITADCIYTAGNLGCAMSHIALWRQAVEEGRAITVAEDDAIFSWNFATRSKEFLVQLPEDWDFVQWGWVFQYRVWVHAIPQILNATMIFDHDQLRRHIADFQSHDMAPAPIRLRHSFGTVCYSLSPKGAHALLHYCTPLTGKLIEFPGFGVTIENKGIDCMMNGAYPTLNAYLSLPPLVVTEHREEETTTREDGVDRLHVNASS